MTHLPIANLRCVLKGIALDDAIILLTTISTVPASSD